MRKIVFQMMISLDGYFEGSNKEIDWHNVDAEFNEHAIDLLKHVDTLLFGRVTYELMADYWPTVDASKDDPVIAAAMNDTAKVVVSRTLKSVSWENTKLISEDIPAELKKLKQQPGESIAVFGSSDLALILLEHDLIDEFQIIVNPLILGSGKTIFKGFDHRLPLKLVSARAFKNGNVLLTYQPIRKEK